MRLFLLALVIAVALAARVPHKPHFRYEFNRWLNQHGKSYAAEEFVPRFKTWKANYKYILHHNKQGKSFTLGLNHMADLSHEEYKSLYLGFDASAKQRSKVNVEVPVVEEEQNNEALPETWDWRSKGAVTPIKNQGQCGSCWSFSAAESIEGCHFLTTGTLVGLSEQNLMDCSKPYGNLGCNGGLMDQAFEYVIHNGGIDTEMSYPYRTATDFVCKYTKENCGSTVTSYRDVPSGSESALQTFVHDAPVAVAIDASHQSFQFYRSGVYYEPECSSTQLDHGVLAVGYGSDYWLVKNSWGTGWGDAGYIEMSRNRNNNCGIATTASRPITCNNCS